MALEIERRFLIDPAKLPNLPNKRILSIVQGYLSKGVRVRRTNSIYATGGNVPEACITIKKTIAHGTNKEFEYEIPVEDGDELLEMCEFTLTKNRYHYPVGNHVFEIDLFTNDLHGLIIAEIELANIQEQVDIPSWFGPEITGNRDYSNNSLASMPDKNEILEMARGKLKE